MPAIKRLPVHIANQIAAGEVVERPSSVVKELIENALDAGANSIEVRLLKGGKRLVEVRDDGIGMSKRDLELSVEPHATSKIGSQRDLECIRTLGFRGEALASIGAVSRLSITSRQKGSGEGWKIDVSFGKRGKIRPNPCPMGTIVTVEDLFLKIPARAKFLKSDHTEYARCLKVVHLFCASWPEVGFKVIRDDKAVFICRTDLPVEKRIEPLVGLKVLPHMIEVGAKDQGLELFGFVARPEAVRLSSKNFYFFLNRRPVSNPVLWKALKDAMKGFLVKGNHPAGVLYIEIDPLLVDVNVHPTKNEVRFERPSDIYRLVFHGVRRALDSGVGTGKLALDVEKRPRLRRGEEPEAVQKGYRSRIEFPLPWEGEGVAPLCKVQEAGGEGDYFNNDEASFFFTTHAEKGQVQDNFRIIGQFAHAFILFELNEELVILDQHAAHEALIFGRIREEFLSAGKLNRQSLLMAHVIDVSPELLENFEKAKKILLDAGIETQIFGHSQIALRSLPVIVSSLEKDILCVEEIVKKVLKNPFMDRGELVRDILAPLSCSMAIKAGKDLNGIEMEKLVRDCLKHGVTNCPHGRPVMVCLGREELYEKFFRR